MNVKLGRWYKDSQFDEYAMPLFINEPKDHLMTFISATIKDEASREGQELKQFRYVLTEYMYADWFVDQTPKLMPKNFSITLPPITMHKAIKAIFKRYS